MKKYLPVFILILIAVVIVGATVGNDIILEVEKERIVDGMTALCSDYGMTSCSIELIQCVSYPDNIYFKAKIRANGPTDNLNPALKELVKNLQDFKAETHFIFTTRYILEDILEDIRFNGIKYHYYGGTLYRDYDGIQFDTYEDRLRDKYKYEDYPIVGMPEIGIEYLIKYLFAG